MHINIVSHGCTGSTNLPGKPDRKPQFKYSERSRNLYGEHDGSHERHGVAAASQRQGMEWSKKRRSFGRASSPLAAQRPERLAFDAWHCACHYYHGRDDSLWWGRQRQWRYKRNFNDQSWNCSWNCQSWNYSWNLHVHGLWNRE